MNTFLRASPRWHPFHVSVPRSDPAERRDSALPAAGARRGILQYLSRAVPREQSGRQRHRRPIPAQGHCTGRQWDIPIIDAPATSSSIGTSAGQNPITSSLSSEAANRRAFLPSGKTTAGIRSSSGASRSSTTSTCSTATGAGCSSASAGTFRSRLGCVSISITGWRAGWRPRASASGRAGTCF